MALNIVEATKFAEDERGKIVEAIDASSIVKSQQPAVGAGSTDSTAFDARTRVLRLHAEEAVRIEFGVSPTAAATSAFRMPANSTEYVSISTFATGFKLATING